MRSSGKRDVWQAAKDTVTKQASALTVTVDSATAKKVSTLQSQVGSLDHDLKSIASMMKQLLIRQDDAVTVEQMVLDIDKLEDEYSMGGDKEIDDLDSTVQEVADNNNTDNNEVHQYLEPSNVVSAATATVPNQNIDHTAQKPRAPAHIHSPTSILKETSPDRSIIEPHAT